MPHACTENQLVEQPAIGLFTELACGPLPGNGELHQAAFQRD